MITKPPPFKGGTIRIPIIIPLKGLVFCLIRGLGKGLKVEGLKFEGCRFRVGV